MGLVRQILVGFAVVALLGACDTGTPGPLPNDGVKACTGVLDCPTGQGCVQKICVDLPCSGRCSLDEICVDNGCFTVDGLSCVDDPSVCPLGFQCSQAAGECQRECAIDDDCTAVGYGSCNVQEGVCGQCTFDSDCKDETRGTCDTSTSKCVGCVANEDCRVGGQAAGLQCDTATQTCIAGCNADTDCATGLRCQGGTQDTSGRCIECTPQTESIDCASSAVGVYCQPTTLMCVECLRNDQCISGQCDTDSNKCVECVQNEYCDQGKTCDLDKFECVEGCAGPIGAANCPADMPACDKTRGPYGTCVTCLRDGDCGWGDVCKKGSGGAEPQCVEGCRVGLTGVPNDGRCQSPEPENKDKVFCDGARGPAGQCVQCLNQSHCSATEVCDVASGACRCKGIGETCGATSECGWRPEVNNGVCDLGTSHKAMCMTKCGNQSVAPICTFGATGQVGAQANCPSGYVTQYASDSNGTTGKRCVPIGYQCN